MANLRPFKPLEGKAAYFNADQILFLNPIGEGVTEIQFPDDINLYVNGDPKRVQLAIDCAELLTEVDIPDEDDAVPPCTPCPELLR